MVCENITLQDVIKGSGFFYFRIFLQYAVMLMNKGLWG
ncbi:hypothetical protein M2132_000401 [Dysgonomonas sp. PH5-45]|nr:hypothetical protein [Dysgonomonas sp. PH5-45]MDH6387070.1 hypothetical protein [Dysgonomonas sp. PH5-37]